MPPDENASDRAGWSAEDFAAPSEHYGQERVIDIEGKPVKLRYLDSVSSKQRLEADIEDWTSAFAGKQINFGNSERAILATLTADIVKLIGACVHHVVEPKMGFKQWAALAESNVERFNRVVAEITRMNIDEDGIQALKKTLSDAEVEAFLGSDFAYKLRSPTSDALPNTSENATSDAL